jgi:orotate phosphoribosyltransferase
VTPPSLFQRGQITLASGRTSDYKIECDALTDEDWETLGYLLAMRVEPFSEVLGVPRGGWQLAEYMAPYAQAGANRLLIVDDVWTTGGSWQRYRARYPVALDPVAGAVVFARGPLPDNVVALFHMWKP